MTGALFFSIPLLVLCTGCSPRSGKKEAGERQRQQTEDMIEANRHILEEEARLINEYIASHNLTMKMSRTGLRYHIEPLGSGAVPKTGEVAIIEYKSSFLDDSPMGAAEPRRMEIRIDQDHTIRGLLEGVKMLRIGDSARFILPSHLAYGVHGVPGEVPSRATAVFDVLLIAIK